MTENLDSLEYQDKRFSLARDRMLEAQVGVIGSLLLDSEHCAGEVFARTKEENYTGEYKTLFSAAKKLYRDGKVIDPMTIRGIVGQNYTEMLVQLMEVTPTAANCKLYVDMLLEQAMLLKLQAAGMALVDCRSTEDAREAVQAANDAMILQSTVRSIGAQDGYMDFLERLENKPEYISWGIPKLDRSVLASSGYFVVIGGRPSAGKTALSLQFAWEQAKNRKVGYFSLETTAELVYDRLVSLASGVSFRRIKARQLSQGEYDKIAAAGEEFGRRKLEVIYANGMTLDEIRAKAMSRGYEIIYVDYLQIVASEDRRSDLRTTVTRISMGLHSIALQLGILVVGLAQLSRPETTQKNSPPGLSSLKESGQIEQDADVVMMLYKISDDARNRKRHLRIAKNKEGPADGYMELDFDGDRQRFFEISSQDDYPSQNGRVDPNGLANAQEEEVREIKFRSDRRK